MEFKDYYQTLGVADGGWLQVDRGLAQGFTLWDTVHEGVRGGDQALNRCLECHASKTTGAAIGSPDAFCQSCHDYVGVKLDCFDCHQGRPGAGARPVARQ